MQANKYKKGLCKEVGGKETRRGQEMEDENERGSTIISQFQFHTYAI